MTNYPRKLHWVQTNLWECT